MVVGFSGREARVEDGQMRAWLQKVAEGDENALRQLYDALAPVVYRFALARLSDPLDAETVVADVMVQLWQQAGRFEGRSAVRTWVLGIARHKILDCLRQRQKQADEDPLDTVVPDATLEAWLSECGRSLAEGERSVAAAQCRAWLEQCLEQLSPPLRQALYLALVEGESYQAIATMLDCPANTVKTRVFHARRQMQQCLQPERDQH